MRYTVVLSPDPQGGFTAVCPAMPGVVTEGDSLAEALANVKESAEHWLMLWLEEGNPLPDETQAMVQEEVAACLADRAEEGLPPTVETRQVMLADMKELSVRAILDSDVLLDYGYGEGLYDDGEDDETSARPLKPCTVRALLRHGGSLGDGEDDDLGPGGLFEGWDDED